MSEITLKELRQASGRTQREVAEKAGITVPAYANLETGRSRLSDSKYKTVLSLAQILGNEIYEIAKNELDSEK